MARKAAIFTVTFLLCGVLSAATIYNEVEPNNS